MRKIPTLFVRDDHDRRYVTERVTPGCEWVLAGQGTATRKYDGTCVRVQNSAGGVYAMWARREVKPGKPEPVGFELVEEDPVTGKRVGWEPALNSSFAQYIEEARQAYAEAHPLPDPHFSDLPSGTYELVGPRINGNPEGYGRHELVRHGRTPVQVERTHEALRLLLTEEHPEWEGLVFWQELGNPDAGLAKIKRRDFPA